MAKPDLDALPGVSLPPGYEVRSYLPGDGRHWRRILAESFAGDPARYSFDRIMRSDPAFQPERVFFLTWGVTPVATAGAYYRPHVRTDASMIHYVAVRPAHQGKRLGYWVTLAALRRMVEEGFGAAWLSTDDFRLPAIRTYLNLGFEPWLVHENQRARWRDVFTELGRPELVERFRPLLDGPVRERGDRAG